WLLEVEDIVLVVPKTQHVVFLLFLDREVAADGKIDDRGADVTHVGGIVDESADLAGAGVVGRPVLRCDGAEGRGAAPRPTKIKHDDKDAHGDDQRGVAAYRAENFFCGSGFVNEAFVERYGDGEAFVIAQRVDGVDFDTVAEDLRV